MAMGNRRQPAAINRKNMDFKVLGRVLGYMMKRYKFRFILVLVCILITAVTTWWECCSCRASSTITSRRC